MADPNQRADHRAVILDSLVETHFPDPGHPNNPGGKPQSALMRSEVRTLHKRLYPELYPVDPPPPPPPPPPPGGRLQATDFAYLGAFRLPEGEAFGWSKGAAAFVEERGSLLVICNDQNTQVAEINIPEIRNSANIADLARATIRTAPTTIVPWNGIRDVEVYGGRLYGHSAAHYEYTRSPRHFAAAVPLSQAGAKGQWYMGTDPPIPHICTNEYLFEIDPQWAAAHTPDKVLACGRHREGQEASGPSIIAFQPVHDAPAGAVLSAKPLLLYGDVAGPKENWIQDHCKADDWRGGAWIGGIRQAVVIFGEKGRGACWYGWHDSDGTRVVAPGGNCAGFPDDGIPCKVAAEGDPKYTGGNRGYNSDTYENWLMLFDPAELAKVARGEIPAHEPQPYAHVNVTPHLLRARESGYTTRKLLQIGGLALDRGGRRLFWSERYGSGGQVLIHVHQVAG